MATLITVGGSSSTGNGTTFGDLIEKVYRRVMGGIRERTVQLAANVTDTQVNVQVTGAQSGSIAPGVILSVELELMYVTAWNATSSTATVTRGYYGSVPGNHDAGVIIYLNPRYSRYDIGVAINDDLRSLSSPTNGLFRVGVAELTYNPVFLGYDLGDLPSDFIDILEIRYRIAPPYRTFPPIKKWKIIRWMANGGVTDPVFPSGRGLIIYESGWPGLPIYVTYSAPFIRFVDTADNVLETPGVNDESAPNNGYSTDTVPNLTSTMLDLPPIGAEIDLTLTREISRNFMESQPDPRKAQEVAPGAIAGSANALIQRRMSRISEEADRLQRQYTKIRSW
jgi:hypothetical protein